MKIVRFQKDKHIAYGLWEGELIREIVGSIYENWQISPVNRNIKEVRLLPPAEPTKIICVGLNFRSHIEELGDKIPEFPSHFLKPLTTVIGPDDAIIYPRVAKRVDYEGEMAVIIKKKGKDIPQEEALNYVLGYTCFNDVTERNLTRVQGQLTRSKGFDTFGSFGPCMATDLDPANLTVRTYLNGKKVQEGWTGEFVFPVPFLIHYISQCMTLLPGDIISTGTPSGVGPMQPGDVVEVLIDGIGTLRNPVKAP